MKITSKSLVAIIVCLLYSSLLFPQKGSIKVKKTKTDSTSYILGEWQICYYWNWDASLKNNDCFWDGEYMTTWKTKNYFYVYIGSGDFRYLSFKKKDNK